MIRSVLLAGLAASLAFGGYQTLRLQIAESSLDQLGRDFGECQATLQAFLEGEEIDNAIPNSLGDFVPPPHWLLPSTGTDR
jgi:hypothetical protein